MHIIVIYESMIYTAYVMLMMRENPSQGQVGGGWAQEIETFLGSVKWHLGSKKSRSACFKSIMYRAVSIRGPLVVLCT